MARKTKKQTLKAFIINNSKLSKDKSWLLGKFINKLNKSIAQSRRMILNKDDANKEEDLISDFNINEGHFVSGVMLRLMNSTNLPNIPDTLLQPEKISLNDLDKLIVGSSVIYKTHYYFILNGEYYITNSTKDISISSFQTYINWFLSTERGDQFYEFTPVVELSNEIRLGDINKISIKENSPTFTDSKQNHEKKKFSIHRDFLNNLITDVPSLQQIIENNILSAELLIKFVKPNKMSKKDYQDIMGTYMKNISDIENVTFSTKKHGIIKGTDILKTKTVEIELTKTDKLNENQLYQEMEKFLSELKNENNN